MSAHVALSVTFSLMIVLSASREYFALRSISTAGLPSSHWERNACMVCMGYIRAVEVAFV